MAEKPLKVRFRVDPSHDTSKIPSEFSLQSNILTESLDTFNISTEQKMTTAYLDHMKPFQTRAEKLCIRLRTSHRARVEVIQRYNDRINTPIVSELKSLTVGKEF